MRFGVGSPGGVGRPGCGVAGRRAVASSTIAWVTGVPSTAGGCVVVRNRVSTPIMWAPRRIGSVRQADEPGVGEQAGDPGPVILGWSGVPVLDGDAGVQAGEAWSVAVADSWIVVCRTCREVDATMCSRPSESASCTPRPLTSSSLHDGVREPLSAGRRGRPSGPGRVVPRQLPRPRSFRPNRLLGPGATGLIVD